MAEWSWSAAVRCGNLGNVEAFVKALCDGGAAGAHLDVSDGVFVRGFGVGTDLVEAVAKRAAIPAELHVQVRAADRLVPSFVALGCAAITIHVECLTHAHRAMGLIRDAGISPGIAICPATPLTALEYLLPSVDRVLLVSRDPGESKRPLPATAFERVQIMRDNIDYRHGKILIEAEGARNARDIAQLIRLGADRVVFDDPDLLRRADLAEAVKDFLDEIRAEQHVA